MAAIEPGYAETGLECAADADHHSEHRAAAVARTTTALRHSAGYDSAGAGHGHAFD